MPRVLVFDVNETLLDLAALDPAFEHCFGQAGVRRAWFAEMLRTAFVLTITGVYHDFGRIARAALDTVARRRGVTLSDADRDALLGGIRRLPPHPDAAPALGRLRDAGLRLAALTNSAPETAVAQLTHAGLDGYFEQILSVDAVRRLKPAPEVYRMAAGRLGVTAADLRLVAAHDWDVTGALRAGCAAAFVARGGAAIAALYERPDVVGPDLESVAEAVLRAEGRA